MPLGGTDIDDLVIDLGDGLTLAIKVILALFLFGIALDTTIDDFRRVARRPLPLFVGVAVQYVLLPALTLVLIAILDVRASIALGMLLVACCPAGNISNLLTHRARGDVALSVSMTATSNLLAMVATPTAFAFWGSLHPAGTNLLQDIDLDATSLVLEVAILVGVPFAAGVFVAARWPGFSRRAAPIVEPAILGLLLLLIVGGAAGQLEKLLNYVGLVVGVVLLQNALALLVGHITGRALRLTSAGVIAMTFEIGIRNTGLALILVLAYFDGLGGMAVTVAVWGLWDVFTGLVLATWWRRRDIVVETASA